MCCPPAHLGLCLPLHVSGDLSVGFAHALRIGGTSCRSMDVHVDTSDPSSREGRFAVARPRCLEWRLRGNYRARGDFAIVYWSEDSMMPLRRRWRYSRLAGHGGCLVDAVLLVFETRASGPVARMLTCTFIGRACVLSILPAHSRLTCASVSPVLMISLLIGAHLHSPLLH